MPQESGHEEIKSEQFLSSIQFSIYRKLQCACANLSQQPVVLKLILT